jgi:hypothetical protein
MMRVARFLDPNMQQTLIDQADATPGAVSRRFSPGNQLRYLPELGLDIIKPGGSSGVPFDGYGTKREAVNKAKAIKQRLRDEIAQANEGI